MATMKKSNFHATPNQFQLPLDDLITNWTAPKATDMPLFPTSGRISIDTETRDETLKDTGPGVGLKDQYIVGISIAFEDGPDFYLPVAHEGGGNCDWQVYQWLKDGLKNFNGKVIGANFKYDLWWLLHEGVDLRNNKLGDIQISGPLINENLQRYSLQSLCERYGLPGKDETRLKRAALAMGVDPKSGLWRLPAGDVAVYASTDAVRTLQVARYQDAEIEKQDLEGILELEEQVLPALVTMQYKGVKVNSDKLDKFEAWTIKEQAEKIAFIKDKTGIQLASHHVAVNSALTKVIDYLGFDLERTSTGAYKIDDAFFYANEDNEVVSALARARKMENARSKFVNSVRKYTRNGRIHCTFNQLPKDDDRAGAGVTGARFGRMSCENPNLQQQPSRDDYANTWRDIYEPDEGLLWATNDFSAQEPRLTAHFAGLANVEGSKAIVERYCENINFDIHQYAADLTGLPRKDAKQVYLGLCYGMKGAKFSRELNLPTRWTIVKSWDKKFDTYNEAEDYARSTLNRNPIVEVAGTQAQALLDNYNKNNAYVSAIAKLCEKRAQERGYLVTLLGRRCRFERDKEGRIFKAHAALNRLIQGSAADQVKKALVNVYKAGFDVRLQVHDELDLFVKNKKEAEEAAQIMIDSVKLLMPSKVDVEVGKSWGTIE